MTPRLVVLDIGATLVTGPDRGPARRIAELSGLDTEQRRRLHRMLMTTDLSGPAAAATAAHQRLGLTGRALEQAIRAVWTAQCLEARLIPGTSDVLCALVGRGYRLALLSNIWNPYLISVRSVLGDFFAEHIPADLQLFSCLEGIAKPAPELFERVLRRATAEPSDAIMVGDSYEKDIEPAMACGMRSVWLPQPSVPADAVMARIRLGAASAPDLTLGSLADVDLDSDWPFRSLT
ncbi:conserved hypothetical protein [Frankia sp. Hr75.2]|nr:conserved hypothetical protein [Frankia sp. Hr75.2]